MALFYSNENFPLPVVVELRTLGHDVLTSQEAGNAGQAVTDSEVLAFAVSTNRTVLTLNRLHFIRLHRSNSKHAGIVVCTFDSDFSRQARRIHDALNLQPNCAGQVIRVNRPANGS